MSFTEQELNEIFGHFAGVEVGATEEKREIDIPTVGKRDIYEAHLPDDEATIKEIAELAEEKGLKLRVWLPGSVGTMDFHTDRLNVHVGPDEQGTYRVQSFSIG